MKARIVKSLVCAGAAGIPLVLAIPALAYSVGSGSSGSAPAVVAGGTPFTVTFTFLQSGSGALPAVPMSADTRVVESLPAASSSVAALPSRPFTATPIVGQGVTFSSSGPGKATFNPPSGTTNSAGQVSTTVTLPPGVPGQYVLTATLASGGTVSVTVVESGGFPNTAADLVHQSAGSQARVAVEAVALLLVLAALGFGLLKVLRPRRTV
jgi:hypothetical protein